MSGGQSYQGSNNQNSAFPRDKVLSRAERIQYLKSLASKHGYTEAGANGSSVHENGAPVSSLDALDALRPPKNLGLLEERIPVTRTLGAGLQQVIRSNQVNGDRRPKSKEPQGRGSMMGVKRERIRNEVRATPKGYHFGINEAYQALADSHISSTLTRLGNSGIKSVFMRLSEGRIESDTEERGSQGRIQREIRDVARRIREHWDVAEMALTIIECDSAVVNAIRRKEALLQKFENCVGGAKRAFARMIEAVTEGTDNHGWLAVHTRWGLLEGIVAGKRALSPERAAEIIISAERKARMSPGRKPIRL